ncbi:MAG: hypothetical protein ACE5DR_04075 [Thermodesulfobacteriota bacterium]
MKFKPLSSRGVKTYSIKGRKSKVSVGDFASCHRAGSSFSDFLSSMPDILGAKDLKAVAGAIVEARQAKRTVAVGMGAHVLKVGLGPLLIDLMERGIISSLAMNGAGIVHDFEIAYVGCTSEDVDAEIGAGAFGMAKETGSLLNRAIKKGADAGKGIGRSVGELIANSRYPNKDKSVLAASVRNDIPCTVHVALGTDILHIHPQMDGSATGRAAMMDFRIFASVVASLERGVYLNIGSAVIMPEVFLKALTLARNLGHDVKNFTTVNMDFIQHYRPLTNVVRRPTMGSGRGYSLTGHHEIMVPLLFAAVLEGLGGAQGKG